jgi:membrane associated rhomboid family serine protease
MLFPLYDNNPHTRLPIITIVLIAANLVCFWLSISGDANSYVKVVYERGFVPQRLTRVDDPQEVEINIELDDGVHLEGTLSTDAASVYPTLLTMMFLHGGWLHLLSNMWMLWVFGDNIEYRLGRFAYLFFYISCGLLAVLTHWAIHPDSVRPVIGASGAIAGVLGAYAVTFPKAKVRTLVFLGFPLLLNLPAALVLSVWLVLQLVGVLIGIGAPANVETAVAFWAHIGGFVAGVVLMPLMTLASEPATEDWRVESEELFEV